MGKADLTLLADGDNIVAEQGEGAAYVIRVSRTAGGVRTWTVGATLSDMATSGEIVANVLALDDALMVASMAPPKGEPIPLGNGKHTATAKNVTPTAAEAKRTLNRQLRLSLLLAKLASGFRWDREVVADALHPAGEVWLSVADMMPVLGTSKGGRSRLVADLHELVRAGMLAYRPSGGGRNRPSLYRYIGNDGKVTATA